jgi:GNAT superfamily N-acetyltransferase
MIVEERSLSADTRVVEAWVAGWALSREAPPPVRIGGALRVDVGLPEQKVRYVFPRLSEHVKRLAESIRDPWMLIKVCASPEAVRELLPQRWVIEKLGFMMTRVAMSRSERGRLPESYKLEVSSGSSLIIAQIRSADGRVAASGRVVLADDFAVYDQIETHVDHRRRGLGSIVMQALNDAALSRPLSNGVLVATEDGRALYEALGWQLHSLFTTALIPGSPGFEAS